MMKVELTNDELNALAGMLDLAVKSGGLQVAKKAVHLLAKLEAAQPVDPPEQEE